MEDFFASWAGAVVFLVGVALVILALRMNKRPRIRAEVNEFEDKDNG